MVFNDKNDVVFSCFKKEFNSDSFTFFTWGDFVKEKNIGIKHLENSHSLYKIVDTKKWTLARLKYGI